MAIIPHDVQCFDLERAFAKAYGLRTETYVCGPDIFKIKFGARWSVVLDTDELEQLHKYESNPGALRSAFEEGYKHRCLVFLSLPKQAK